jgi:hypothetical protein
MSSKITRSSSIRIYSFSNVLPMFLQCSHVVYIHASTSKDISGHVKIILCLIKRKLQIQHKLLQTLAIFM